MQGDPSIGSAFRPKTATGGGSQDKRDPSIGVGNWGSTLKEQSMFKHVTKVLA